jgi:hypothetical protein
MIAGPSVFQSPLNSRCRFFSRRQSHVVNGRHIGLQLQFDLISIGHGDACADGGETLGLSVPSCTVAASGDIEVDRPSPSLCPGALMPSGIDAQETAYTCATRPSG